MGVEFWMWSNRPERMHFTTIQEYPLTMDEDGVFIPCDLCTELAMPGVLLPIDSQYSRCLAAALSCTA